ncbi:cache domain-containing protein [Gimesia algae]|nr:cache domain-containing protein [Gimesia algae]
MNTPQHPMVQPSRHYQNLNLKILISVVAAIMLLIGCRLWMLYWQEQQSINADVKKRVKGASHVLDNNLNEDANTLRGFLQFISSNKSLQDAWLNQNREELLQLALPIYKNLNASNRVTHFYFMNLDRSCVLRVHRPGDFGDTIDRYTMQQAASSAQSSSGIELGKYGHFTLRVVSPWIVDGQLVGYIELGEEIEHITPQLSKNMDIDVVFAIEKEYLNREHWETGLKILNRPGDWSQLSKYVIIDKSIEHIPAALTSLINSGNLEKTPVSFTDHTTQKDYHGGSVPLKDVSDQQVGRLIVLRDISAQTAELHKMAGLLLIGGCIVGTGLFSICLLYISALQKTSWQLIQTAHQAGKAEIATSVLHNVGNVLNSVNVSASLIQNNVNNSSSKNLGKAVEVIEHHLTDLGQFVTHDERGKHLPRFLIDVSHELSSEEDKILDEINSLIRNIDHIKTIVEAQQKHAKDKEGFVEIVSLIELMEDAININIASMERHSVKIQRNYSDIDRIVTDKQLLLQIFINLINNAKYACLESNHQEHQITLGIQPLGKERVMIKIEDNGMGIDSKNLTKIFAHGFTTRQGGHGFGLHSSALAATELGGSLVANSQGPGTGAIFTLEIPYRLTGAKLCKT